MGGARCSPASCLLLPAHLACGGTRDDSLRFDIRFAEELCPDTLDGRLLLLLSTDDSEEPRFQIKDGPGDPARLRHRRGGPGPRRDGLDRRRRPRLPRRQPRRPARRRLHRPGPPPPLRDLPPRRRPHREAPHGPRRGPAVEQGPRQPLQPAPEGDDRPRRRGRGGDRSGHRHPAHRAPADHEVRQAREDPERAPHRVLGTADAPRGPRPAAGGLRRAPGGPLPADHLPRPLPPRLRGLPRGAAGPRPRARVLRALRLARLQPDRAGARPPVLQGVDRPRLPADDHHRDPARQPLLRRLLRRELGQPGALRRRHHLRADPLHREEVPGDRRGLGPLHVRGIDRRAGRPSRSR